MRSSDKHMSVTRWRGFLDDTKPTRTEKTAESCDDEFSCRIRYRQVVRYRQVDWYSEEVIEMTGKGLVRPFDAT